MLLLCPCNEILCRIVCTNNVIRTGPKIADQVFLHVVEHIYSPADIPNNKISLKKKGYIFCVCWNFFICRRSNFVCWTKLKCGADISKWERHDGLMAKTLWVVKSGSAARTLFCDEGCFTQCGLHIVFMVGPAHLSESFTSSKYQNVLQTYAVEIR